MEDKIKKLALNFVQLNASSLRGMNSSNAAQLGYEEGCAKGMELQAPKPSDPNFVPVWHDNDPEKYVYFTEGSAFLVYTEDEDGKGSYDMVCADCSGEEMVLNYAYTGNEFDYHWDQIIRFSLIEGKMPQKEING